MQESNEVLPKSKVVPVSFYTVSKDWIEGLFHQVQRHVMNKAIAANCPKEFLAVLNELELDFTEDATVSVSSNGHANGHADGAAAKPAPQAAAPAAEPAQAPAAAPEPAKK